MKLFVIGVFLITYILLMLKRGHPFIVLGTAIAALLLSGAINTREAFLSINYNWLVWGR